MKIIIDIRDDDYYDIIGDALIGDFSTKEIINAIKDGTTLPKDQYQIIHQIEALHAKATALGYIQKPLAWALYQVWQEVDKEESEDMKHEMR